MRISGPVPNFTPQFRVHTAERWTPSPMRQSQLKVVSSQLRNTRSDPPVLPPPPQKISHFPKPCPPQLVRTNGYVSACTCASYSPFFCILFIFLEKRKIAFCGVGGGALLGLVNCVSLWSVLKWFTCNHLSSCTTHIWPLPNLVLLPCSCHSIIHWLLTLCPSCVVACFLCLSPSF